MVCSLARDTTAAANKKSENINVNRIILIKFTENCEKIKTFYPVRLDLLEIILIISVDK